MNHSEAIQYLYSLQLMGMKLGLDNMVQLCGALDHPERRLKFIHVAGTNGKGSTCALLASIFQAAGYRIGLYTSPHLIHFRERIRLNGEMISEAELTGRVERIRTEAEKLEKQGSRLTFFEATTGLALDYFAAEKVDLVIWETGLGGRLDATNVVWPECSVITRLAIDHEKFLGGDLSRIAYEKAGILKSQIPAVILRAEPEAELVLRARAQEAGCEVEWVGAITSARPDRRRGVQRFEWQGMEFESRLLGRHQMENLALALTVVEKMRERGWRITPEASQRGVAEVVWPARFQILRNEPPLVLDGGHNPNGLRAAVNSWKEFYGNGPGRCIFGALEDKRIEEMASLLDEAGREIWLVPVKSGRQAPLEEMKKVWAQAGVRLFESAAQAWAEEQAHPSAGGTLICGSLYLAGEILGLIEEKEDQVLLNG